MIYRDPKYIRRDIAREQSTLEDFKEAMEAAQKDQATQPPDYKYLKWNIPSLQEGIDTATENIKRLKAELANTRAEAANHRNSPPQTVVKGTRRASTPPWSK